MTNDDTLTIGAVARAAGVGRETVRFYERKGPDARKGSGFRRRRSLRRRSAADRRALAREHFRAPDMGQELSRLWGLQDESELRARVADLQVVEHVAEGAQGTVGSWVRHAVQTDDELVLLVVRE